MPEWIRSSGPLAVIDLSGFQTSVFQAFLACLLPGIQYLILAAGELRIRSRIYHHSPAAAQLRQFDRLSSEN
jgi:hypothetical protein